MNIPDIKMLVSKMIGKGFRFRKAVVEYENEGLIEFREFYTPEDIGMECGAIAIQLWSEDNTCYFIRGGNYLCSSFSGPSMIGKEILEKEFALKYIDLKETMYPKVFGIMGAPAH